MFCVSDYIKRCRCILRLPKQLSANMFYPVIVIIVKMNITIRKHTKMESYPKGTTTNYVCFYFLIIV